MSKKLVIASMLFISIGTLVWAKYGHTVVVNQDPDYCAGIACTETTDTCCDEGVQP